MMKTATETRPLLAGDLFATRSPFYPRLRAVCGILLEPSSVLGPSSVSILRLVRICESHHDFRKIKIDSIREKKWWSLYHFVERFKKCGMSIELDWNAERGSIHFLDGLKPFSRFEFARSDDVISWIFPGNKEWSGWPLLLLKSRLISLKFLKVEARWNLVFQSLWRKSLFYLSSSFLLSRYISRLMCPMLAQQITVNCSRNIYCLLYFLKFKWTW